MTLEWRAAKDGKTGAPGQWRLAQRNMATLQVAGFGMTTSPVWSISDSHCAGIDGKAKIKRASLKRPDPPALGVETPVVSSEFGLGKCGYAARGDDSCSNAAIPSMR